MINRITILFFFLSTWLPGVASPAGSDPCIFFIQKDLSPGINYYSFPRGMSFLLRSLPQGRRVVIVSTQGSQNRVEYDGVAGLLKWPPAGFQFGPQTRKTAFFANLLAYLEDQGVSDVTLFLIKGESDDNEFRRNDNMSDPGFATTRVVDYCRKNRVRLVGFSIQRPAQTLSAGDTGFLRLGKATATVQDDVLYVINSTNGCLYYDFGTFEGVFAAALKKYF